MKREEMISRHIQFILGSVSCVQTANDAKDYVDLVESLESLIEDSEELMDYMTKEYPEVFEITK